jgi:hypothetical protein
MFSHYFICSNSNADIEVDGSVVGNTFSIIDVTARLDKSGDKTWLRSRALVHAYREGDQSMLDCVPDRYALRIVSEALKRPKAFFEWVINQSKTQRSSGVIKSSERYLAAATWPWDKACILAGALLATLGDMPAVEAAETLYGEFPYWAALDKHTPEGKVALTEVAKEVHSSYRQLIWASFYCESAFVNRLLPSPWWDAERTWRLRRAGLSSDTAEALWSRARPLVRQHLEEKAASLKDFVETAPFSQSTPNLWSARG